MMQAPVRGTAAAATTLLLLSSCSLFGGRSSEAFCDELAQGSAVMETNYTSTAKEDTLGMLGVTAANIGEFTRMVHKLDEVAPAEIESDMHAVREVWDSQADMIKESVSNPLGAIVGGLAASVMTSGSTKAVDQFAMDNCGSQLFGSVARA